MLNVLPGFQFNETSGVKRKRIFIIFTAQNNLLTSVLVATTNLVIEIHIEKYLAHTNILIINLKENKHSSTMRKNTKELHNLKQ